jgi:hypothetical protein
MILVCLAPDGSLETWELMRGFFDYWCVVYMDEEINGTRVCAGRNVFGDIVDREILSEL